MSEDLYVSHVTVDKLGSLHRRAHLPLGATADFGVHGPIVELFKLQPERELPLPVDFIVAAAAGWMLGTLNGALEVRQVKLEGDAMRCSAQGVNIVRAGLPVLTEIRVHYRLRIPAGTRDTVERALAKHKDKCPTAAALQGGVAVSWTAEIEESAV